MFQILDMYHRERGQVGIIYARLDRVLSRISRVSIQLTGNVLRVILRGDVLYVTRMLQSKVSQAASLTHIIYEHGVIYN